MRDFRGVGTESSYQALSNFALLTKTSQWTPVATFGGASNTPFRIACCCASRFGIILAGFRRKLSHQRPGRTCPDG